MINVLLVKRAVAIAVILVPSLTVNAIAARPDRWEYQGVASTGEEVYLNLDSIQASARGSGYFFKYQIGQERPDAYTTCDGRFQVFTSDGVTLEAPIEPQSESTRNMLRRICTYHLSR